MCVSVQTFELDSANTCVTSHLVGGFAVIFPYVRGFKTKDMKTRVEVFGGDFKFLAASNLLSVFNPHHFEGGRSRNFALEDHIRTFQGSDWRRLLGKNRRGYRKKRGRTMRAAAYQRGQMVSASTYLVSRL